MRGEGTKGDTGEPAGFGNVTASVTTSLPYGSTPQVSVEKSGEDTALNLDFQFGLVEGEAAGFSTNQKSNIEFISVTSNPSVSITTDNTSPNNSKVFNFDFKIPEPLGISEITAVTTTTSEGINEITIWYNNGTTTSFNISNGAQGETGFIEGEVATTTELPAQGNHIGRGFLVGQEGTKHLFVYLNNEWTDQGLILGAGFGEPTSSAESIPTTSLSTASGSLVHIMDAAAMPVESLKVEVEPVQDLHGYDAPWPAGGNPNNILPPAPAFTQVVNDVTFTSDGKGIYTINGTASGSSAYYDFEIPEFVFPNETVYLHLNNTEASSNVAIVLLDTVDHREQLINKTPSTVDTISTGVNLYGRTAKGMRLFLASGGSVSNMKFSLAVNNKSTTVTYSPYSNECPISGHTSITLPRTGANLLDYTSTLAPGSSNGISYTINSDGSVTLTNGTATAEFALTLQTVAQSATLKYLLGHSVTLSGTPSGGSSSTYWMQWYLAESGITRQDFGSGVTFTPTMSTGNIAIRVKNGYTIPTGGITFKPMLTYGSTASAYEPYQGQTVIINLNGERYGATVDALTGVMTVDRAIKDLGTLSWSKLTETDRGVNFYTNSITDIAPSTGTSIIQPLICSQYRAIDWNHFGTNDFVITEVAQQIRIKDSNLSSGDTSAFTAAMSGVQLVYPLASLTTVQLTPTELSFLLGTNNVWADTGDIEVTYTKMNEPSVEVTVDPESPESAKIFDFNFKIPQGEKGDKGDTPIIELSTSVTTLPQNTDPTLSLTTLGENNFRFDFGLPKGFVQEMTATATANDLEPGSDASATVTVNQNNLNFTFGIPQGIIGKNGIGVSTLEFEGQSLTTGGNIYKMNFAEPDSDTMAFSTIFEAPQGPEGIGFYQKLEFTSTDSNLWIDGENGTSTLVIDRTAKEIIPINIYNSTSNNIAATFTLADPTEQYPYGSIQYNTNEKFDGTLYYIGESPTPQVEIGSVTTVAGTTASVIASKNGHNTVLDFVFPTKGDKGDTGTSIASVTYDHEADNKTYYKMLFTDSTSTLFAVDKGDKGDTGTSISSITEGLSTSGNKMYTITFTDTLSPFIFEVEKGDQGDKGDKGDAGTIQIGNVSSSTGAGVYNTGTASTAILDFDLPKGDKGDQGIQGYGITNISAPVVDGLIKTYTITYGNNDNTTSFSVEDGLAATISFSSGVIINNNIEQPTVTVEGTSTNPLLTFNFPQTMVSSIIYTASTADFPEGGSLATGTFYFQYEEE